MTRFDEHHAPPSPPVDAFKAVREANAIWNSHLYQYIAPDGRRFDASGTEVSFKTLSSSELAEISDRADGVEELKARRLHSEEARRFKEDLKPEALNALPEPAPVAPIGKKYDNGKTRYDLIPPKTLAEVAEVLTAGAKKYGDENWREVPDALRRYYAAAMRHIEAFRQGNFIDDETGETHLAHAICCLIFLNEMFYE